MKTLVAILTIGLCLLVPTNGIANLQNLIRRLKTFGSRLRVSGIIMTVLLS